MSLVSSPPSKPESDLSATSSRGTSASKIAFKDSVWRPVATCGGALAIGLLLSPFFLKPVKIEGAKNELPQVLLPEESTMILAPSAPPGALLLGQVKLVANITGKSTVGGAVARQVVEPGTRVKKGDPVVEISTGESERPAPAAERLQSRAEQSQIAASNAQNKVAEKIAIAQTQLRVAQDRVNSAQAQVGTARDIVRRLQNGEAVSSSEIPAPYRTGTTEEAPSRKRKAEPATPAPNRAGEIALRQAEAARDAVKQGTLDLKTARQMLNNAKDAAAAANDKLKAATKNVDDVEARFDDKKATGADVEQARADQRDAQATVTSSTKAVTTAQAEVTKREKAANSLQSYADKAAADAKAAMKDVKLFDPAPTEEPTPEDSSKVTLKQAIKFAGAALEESKRASRDAEKLHNQIDDYQRAVKSSTAQVESASQNLAEAQQKVMDSVPRASFTPILSPAEGVVTWISRLAREVTTGQSVFGIAEGTKVGARFEDKSDLWKGLKVGTVLSAIATPDTKAKEGAETPVNAAPALVQVKVTEVEQPQAPGEAAVVSGDVSSTTSGSPSPLSAGTTILASVAKPGQKPTLSIPTSALIPSGSDFLVAVLAPAKEAENKDGFHLVWKSVKVGRGDGMRREILTGIEAGNRIVSQPDELAEMGFLPPAAATTSTGGTAVPQEVSSDDFLVRLTPTSA